MNATFCHGGPEGWTEIDLYVVLGGIIFPGHLEPTFAARLVYGRNTTYLSA